MTETTNIAAGLELAKALLEYDKDEFLKGPTFHGDRSWPVDEESANDCTAAIAAVTGAAAELQRLQAERDELAAQLEAIERAGPVMWMARKADGRIAAWTSASDETIRLAREVGTEVRPLYACPQPPESGSPEEFATSEAPRCLQGGGACEGCLMIGWCIGDEPSRQPLTYEQLDAIADAHRWDTREGRRELMRAAIARAVKGSAA